jgi:hypothetical protein
MKKILGRVMKVISAPRADRVSLHPTGLRVAQQEDASS